MGRHDPIVLAVLFGALLPMFPRTVTPTTTVGSFLFREGNMGRNVGFTVSDEIGQFVDYYADQHATTASAMAKRGMMAEMKRHPLKQAQLDEYERIHGPPPLACVPVRDTRAQTSLSSSSISLESKKEAMKKEYESGVFLSPVEHENLERDYGAKNTAAALKKLSAYKASTGTEYQKDSAAIRNWVMAAVLKGEKVPEPTVEEGCPECHVKGGSHGAFCSRKLA